MFYTGLGQVEQVSKPFHLATITDQPKPFITLTTFDFFNRVQTVTDQLGVIDSSGAQKSTIIITKYNGSTIETDRQVTDAQGNLRTQTRLETKNAIGKLEEVQTLTENGLVPIFYAYDADGRVTCCVTARMAIRSTTATIPLR